MSALHGGYGENPFIHGSPQPVEGLIIPVHVLVEPFHDVREGLHVSHFGLFPVPLGEGVDGAPVGGIADAAVAARLQRVLETVETCKVLDDEIRMPVLATSFIRDGCGLPTPPFGSRGGARPTPGRPRCACRALRGQAAAAGSGSAARSPGAVAPR